MTSKTMKTPRNLRIPLLVTRIIASLIILFIVPFLIGYTVNPQGNQATPNEIILLLLFPIGMCIGYLVAWRWPLSGGIISSMCSALFMILKGDAGMTVMVLIFSMPGFLFIFYGLLLSKRFSVGKVSD
jgi:hypothetical protein